MKIYHVIKLLSHISQEYMECFINDTMQLWTKVTLNVFCIRSWTPL